MTKILPNHISDILNLFHDIVFTGTDGEETFDQFLSLEQKECISLALTTYYQCQECQNYHSKILANLKNTKIDTLNKHVSSMILFLRTDINNISTPELNRWLETWDQLATKIITKYHDPIIPMLVAFSIGVARNDKTLINMFGKSIKKLNNYPQIIKETIAVTLFMKTATSSNRITNTIDKLLEIK